MFDGCSFSGLVGCFVLIFPVRSASPLRSSTLVIIPACAGNTVTSHFPNAQVQDHPRMCREHNGLRYDSGSNWGSSPHVQGTPAVFRPPVATPEIIPACAGNTARSTSTRRPAWDHPRVCGEHMRVLHVKSPELGSSPHVRGTHLDPDQARQGQGIIPACAGNTPVYAASVFEVWDHPRMCGEHRSEVDACVSEMGSSPHVRGTRFAEAHVLLVVGIIPACAGNTPAGRSCHGVRGDHPRMCGEHRKCPNDAANR